VARPRSYGEPARRGAPPTGEPQPDDRDQRAHGRNRTDQGRKRVVERDADGHAGGEQNAPGHRAPGDSPPDPAPVQRDEPRADRPGRLARGELDAGAATGERLGRQRCGLTQRKAFEERAQLGVVGRTERLTRDIDDHAVDRDEHVRVRRDPDQPLLRPRVPGQGLRRGRLEPVIGE
jgi:hypothetical protein